MKIEKLLEEGTIGSALIAARALDEAAPELIALVKAARMLYDDTMDYIRINNLGGENNHSLKAVRDALAALNKHEAWREE